MLTLKKLSLTTASSSFIFFATALSAGAASFYSITELPFTPSDINDNGQIVGQNYLWTNGTIIDFHSLISKTDFYNLIYELFSKTEDFKFFSEVEIDRLTRNISENPGIIKLTAINNQGNIVGYWGDNVIGEQAFISDGTSNIRKIDRPPVNFCGSGSGTFCNYLIPYDINDAGQIALAGLPIPQSLRYGANGLLRNVDGTFTNLRSSRYILGMALNNSGQVIENFAGGGSTYTYFYENGNFTSLYSTEFTKNYTSFIPLQISSSSINDRGQVVGSGSMIYNQRDIYSPVPIHGLLWNDPEQNPVGIDLGTLGGNYSKANSINNLGQIVGASGSTSNSTSAVIWEENNIYDLNKLIDNNLGWQLTYALKINNQGQIIGSGYLNGQQRNFLLTPVSQSVPEPTSAFSLLGFAAFGIGWQMKRQLSKKKSEHLVS